MPPSLRRDVELREISPILIDRLLRAESRWQQSSSRNWKWAERRWQQVIGRRRSARSRRRLPTTKLPQALEGLGLAAWWLDLAPIWSSTARERAYRAVSRAQGRTRGRGTRGVWLAWDSAAFRGEHAIASGWLQRARRLLDDHPDRAEHAWLALRAGVFALLDEGNPEEAEPLAHETIESGRALGAVDYEMAGRALDGFAHVTRGRVAEGLRELDEVSAAILAGDSHRLSC